MPEITSYAEGSPSWVELSTTDEKGALAFYSALFGWEDEPVPIGPDAFYHMQRLNGLTAAAISQQNEEERNQGVVHSYWRVYFTVNSADQVADRIKNAGGSVVDEPFDVFDAGRMAVARDPQGAFFCVWEPKRTIGSTIRLEPGAFAWAELLTTDSKAAAEFYEATLGMEPNTITEPMDYTMLQVGGQNVGGMMNIMPQMGPIPPHWMAYFTVADVEATAERAKSLGGQLVAGPMGGEGIGRWTTLRDPQGATFGVHQM